MLNLVVEKSPPGFERLMRLAEWKQISKCVPRKPQNW